MVRLEVQIGDVSTSCFLKRSLIDRLLGVVKWKITVNEGVINNITKMARVLVGVKRVIDYAVKVSVTIFRSCTI